MAALLGYARVSTGEQELALQHDALTAAGCVRIFSDTASGALEERVELARALDHLREGDTLVVWRLDRLGRSLRHLIDTVTALADRGVGFRSLQESIDTTTPGGRLIFHVFGALAEFERELIRERTQAGLAAARARGRKGGRRTVMTTDKLKVAREMHRSREHTIAAIAQVVGVSRATIYRALSTHSQVTAPTPEPQPSLTARHPEPRPYTAAERVPSAAVHATPPTTDPAPTPTREARAPRASDLPGQTAALQRDCPRCGARAGVMCRQISSRAKRKPAAPQLHRARFWLERRCPACRARPGQPCQTPNGAKTAPHAPRLTNTRAEVEALPATRSEPAEGGR